MVGIRLFKNDKIEVGDLVVFKYLNHKHFYKNSPPLFYVIGVHNINGYVYHLRNYYNTYVNITSVRKANFLEKIIKTFIDNE